MASINGMIFDIKKYSIHDGPGIRTTVFFKGCPLRCWWCHNPESQSRQPELMLRGNRCVICGACEGVCPEHAIYTIQEGVTEAGMPMTDRSLCKVCGTCVEACYSGAREWVGRTITVDEVMYAIERDVPFYDQSGGGVTFSGGEPLMQPEFLLSLLRACRTANIHTALDTCGYAPWRSLEKIAAEVDLFLYDVKLIDEAQHRVFTGVSNRLILNNLRRLSAMDAVLIVRHPLIPGINDDETSLRMLGEFLTGLRGVREVEITPYHPIAEAKYDGLGLTYQLPGLKTPNPDELARAVQTLRNFGLTVKTLSSNQSALPEVSDDDHCACADLTPTISTGH